MDSLSDMTDLGAARRLILGAAEDNGTQVAVAMLSEALEQLENLSPPLSAEVWDAYATVLRRASDPSPGATVVRLHRQQGA